MTAASSSSKKEGMFASTNTRPLTRLSSEARISLNPTPFSTYFGGPIDASFTNVQGQVTADLNGDGAPDLLIYGIGDNGTSSNPVRVQSFVSNGRGGFTAGMPQQLMLPATPYTNVAVTSTPPAIDVNGDGKLDL